jgi:hypothetical protein
VAEQLQLDLFVLDTFGMLLANGLVTEGLCLLGVLVPPVLQKESGNVSHRYKYGSDGQAYLSRQFRRRTL